MFSESQGHDLSRKALPACELKHPQASRQSPTAVKRHQDLSILDVIVQIIWSCLNNFEKPLAMICDKIPEEKTHSVANIHTLQPVEDCVKPQTISGMMHFPSLKKAPLMAQLRFESGKGSSPELCWLHPCRHVSRAFSASLPHQNLQGRHHILVVHP